MGKIFKENVKKDLVTVYIPNYNYGNYIENAIKSILEQTYKNIEIIIIDDGSTDNSKNILKKFYKYKNIKIIEQKNKGLLFSSNLALKISSGKYIMRLDADDWLDNNCIEILLNTIKKDKKIGLVFPDYYLTTKEGNIIKQVRRHNFDKVKLLDQPAHGACTLISRELLIESGGYSKNFICQDGYDLWFKFIQKYKIKNINLPLFFYRQHANSLSTNEKRILYTRSKIYKKYEANFHKNLNVIAIIPVRGRNIDPNSLAFKKINGKYVIDYTIETALKFKQFKKILISTHDEEIIKYIQMNFKSKKILFDKRKNNFMDFSTPIDELVKNSLDKFNFKRSKYDAVMSLTIDYPFRSNIFISSAISVMKIFKVQKVISVRKEDDQFYKHDGNGLESVQTISSLQLEREDLYRQTGTINLWRIEALKNYKKKLTIGHIMVDRHNSFRVKNIEDLKIGRVIQTLIKNE